MIDFQITDGFGIVLAWKWSNWTVGFTYHEQEPNIRSIIVHLGPFHTHFIAS